MASTISDDDSSDTNYSENSLSNIFQCLSADLRKDDVNQLEDNNKINIVNKLFNRQLYGRFTKNSKSKTERAFNSIHWRCRYKLNQLINSDVLNHIFMGFTLCGNFFISYKETFVEAEFIPSIEYELYVWRFSPGKMLEYISKHRIFKLHKGSIELEDITFMQYPTDPYKILCYGVAITNPIMAFITILTLPINDSCKYCNSNPQTTPSEDLMYGWCMKHGFILHFMFSMMQPAPKFEPDVSLSYPDHLVFNTGHYIHILKVSNFVSPPVISSTIYSHPIVNTIIKDEEKNSNYNDTFSEISETASDNLSTNSVVEAIIEDFSEYDLEGADGNKPFHELNISCEPLNVTGKSYHNALVQNITDPRLKRLQNNKDCLFSIPQSSNTNLNSSSQKASEKSKIDKKIAEKTYEFIEENEKCEKLSSFRKKRLAEKKYEFSEDNLENIVPFNSLRKERRYLYRSQNRCIRSPDFMTNTLFLSPRSSRSPMQSPNSRNNGQFSPGSGRNIYCPLVNRNSPHYSRNSNISPKDTARKINVYSPSIDSDCSDNDSKLILRHVNNHSTSQYNERKMSQHVGLLIVDAIRDDSSRWIKKLVRRFSSVDFETSSLVSGQSRDEYNIPIEIPILVQTLTDQQLDIVPEFNVGNISETQIIVSQRTFDCEQFVQRRAQKLCRETNLEFLHCEDYDIKLLSVCPLNGEILCQAVIKIVALHLKDAPPKPETYLTECFFTWDINTDAFELIDPPEKFKLIRPCYDWNTDIDIKKIYSKKAVIMKVDSHFSKSCLRDYNENYEIYIKDSSYCDQQRHYLLNESY